MQAQTSIAGTARENDIQMQLSHLANAVGENMEVAHTLVERLHSVLSPAPEEPEREQKALTPVRISPMTKLGEQIDAQSTQIKLTNHELREVLKRLEL